MHPSTAPFLRNSSSKTPNQVSWMLFSLNVLAENNKIICNIDNQYLEEDQKFKHFKKRHTNNFEKWIESEQKRCQEKDDFWISICPL